MKFLRKIFYYSLSLLASCAFVNANIVFADNQKINVSPVNSDDPSHNNTDIKGGGDLRNLNVQAQTKSNNMNTGDIQVKFGAFIDSQVGLRFQNKLTKSEKNVSARHHGFALFNKAGLTFNASNAVDEFKYGAKVILVPTTQRKGGPAFNGTHIYVETNYGRIEIGSPDDAANTMMINGGSVGVASGEWSKYVKLTETMKQNEMQPSFAKFYDFIFDDVLASSITQIPYTGEPSRRIVYYTPKFALNDTGTNLQLGIAYTPDSSNTGARAFDKFSNSNDEFKIGGSDDHIFVIDNSVRNGVSGGISLEHNISDGIDVKLALTGEIADPTGVATEKIRASSDVEYQQIAHKLEKVRTYNAGVVFDIGNFSYGASYGSWGKSLTTPAFHKTGRGTKYFDTAARYTVGPFRTGLRYFNSNKFKNRLDVVSLGGDYRIVQGLKSYIALSLFQFKGKPEFYPELSNKKINGKVVVIGSVLNF